MTFSRLMLGTAQFGLHYGIANTHGMPDDEEIAAILKESYDSGITSIDTSADYGSSEERLGVAMKRLGLLGRFQIVTKIPKIPNDASDVRVRLHIEEHLRRSLDRLKLQQLSTVLFHAESDAVHLPLLERMVEKGCVRRVGVSLDSANHPPEALQAPCVQIPCNILDHRFDSLVDSATADRRVVFARSAYLQGLLLMPEDKVPPHLAPIMEYRQKIISIADESAMSVPRLALGYLFSQTGITSVVMGMESVEQLRGNIRIAAAPPLPQDLAERLKAVAGILPESLIRPMLWSSEMSDKGQLPNHSAD